MSSKSNAIICIVILFALNSSWSQNFSPFRESYNRLVQGISFSSDKKTLYMALPHKERLEAIGQPINNSTPRLAIYESKLDSTGKWSKPTLLEFSGRFKDYEPTTSPNGKLLLFNSNRPIQGKSSNKNNIWFSQVLNEKWSIPKPLGLVNSIGFEESYPSISLENKLIYSKEIRVNNKSNYRLFETKFNGANTKMGREIRFPNFGKQASDPWISPRGDYLVFTGFELKDWNHTCDLFLSFYKNGKWSEPQPITELNSPGPDFSPTISKDNEWIYYRKNYRFLKVRFRHILNSYRIN